MKTQEYKDKVTLAMRDATKKWRKRHQSSTLPLSTSKVRKKQRKEAETRSRNTHSTASESFTRLEVVTDVERMRRSASNHSTAEALYVPMPNNLFATTISHKDGFLPERDMLSFNEKSNDVVYECDHYVRNNETHFQVLRRDPYDGKSLSTSCVHRSTTEMPHYDET
jgi:hypothetical protein